MKYIGKSIIICCLCLFFSGCQKQGFILPQGFSYLSQENDIIVQDEKGNEYVWIPVREVSRYDFDQQQVIEKDKAINRIFYGEGRKESILYETDYDISYFIESVKKHGGFFVSRYEIGKENDLPVSKAGYEPFTYITRDEALSYSHQLLQSNQLQSSLINSYAWDSLIRYCGDAYQEKQTNEIKQIQLTGSSEDICKGIYDLAGNVSEWTSEYSSNAYYSYREDCVNRGSHFMEETKNPTKRNYNANVANEFIGFRVILYWK